MKKSEFNSQLRSYIKEHLSPTDEERNFVKNIYQALQDVLGEGNCLRIGSYPRFTSVTPLHDLDVLYILGNRDGTDENPSQALIELEKKLRKSYINPTRYILNISRQTHSITVTFLDNGKEFFAIDVVPAYISGKNNFGEDTYVVPEIFSKHHTAKIQQYEELAKNSKKMSWIKSDPRGYIHIAQEVNESNSDFRKSVKFIKAWKYACKDFDQSFKLKSFHIEQVLTEYFYENRNAEIYDAVFDFFCALPMMLEQSWIQDRADSTKNIDEYIDQFTEKDKQLIKEIRDFFLIKLEDFKTGDNINTLFRVGRRKRASETEAYLFDQEIPVLINNEEPIGIQAHVLQRRGGFREFILDSIGLIEVDRRIEFRLHKTPQNIDLFKWKVKNDDSCQQPRGEITDHRTLRDPESTQYNGKHFVECYAIRDGVCVARARQNVELRRIFN